MLLTGNGHPVIGDGEPITLPPVNRVEIGDDGTVAVAPLGEQGNNLDIVNRIKLVNPPGTELVKGNDGLMRLRDGGEAAVSANVKVVSGMLESSNVNIAEALVNMIDLSRQFEMQIRVIRDAEKNADSVREIVRLA